MFFFFKPPTLLESISYLNSVFQGMTNVKKGPLLKPFSVVRVFVLIPKPLLASALFPHTAGSGFQEGANKKTKQHLKIFSL